MKRTLSLALAFALAGCAHLSRKTPHPEPVPAPVSEASIGLVKGSLFDVVEPPRVEPNDSSPGELPVLHRAYPGAPPEIPHGIADFVPITADTNACVTCHGVAEKEEGGPTPIPASHYTDLRNAPGRRGENVAGARNTCTLCHLPQTGAKPLVGNRF